MPAISGAATLVPPNTWNADAVDDVGANTATPVLGSATAETSASMRRAQPASCCQLGLANTVLQPLPAPLHTVSRGVAPMWTEVPPIARTPGEVAGNCGPPRKPLSPELAVTVMPAWVYDADSELPPDSPPP